MKTVFSFIETGSIGKAYGYQLAKKSIYPEFFPDSIHVKEDNDTVINYMTNKLAASDIEYVIPYNELLEASLLYGYVLLYNHSHYPKSFEQRQ